MLAKSPCKPPIGVRAAPTITIGSFCKDDLPSADGRVRAPRERDRRYALFGPAEGCEFFARRGRWTSSPPQFGQMPLSALAHVAQNVHS